VSFCGILENSHAAVTETCDSCHALSWQGTVRWICPQAGCFAGEGTAGLSAICNPVAASEGARRERRFQSQLVWGFPDRLVFAFRRAT
jgi:hypothetical protein